MQGSSEFPGSLAAEIKLDILHRQKYSLIHCSTIAHLEKGVVNEVIALATILLNGLEKTVSYRLQLNAPKIMHESNPIARLVIQRCGLFPTHLVFLILSTAIVSLTYALAKFSPIANFCLWLEFTCSAFVFFNNWILERLYCR